MIQSKFKVALVAALLAGLLTGAGMVYQPLVNTIRAQQPRPARPALQAGTRHKAVPSSPTWRERETLRGHTGMVSAVAVSSDGKLLASGGRDTDVILWDAATAKVKATLQGHKQPISCVAFSPDGTLLASGSSDTTKQVGEVKLWDVAAGKERAAFKLGEAGGSVSSLAFSPDGKLLAASGDLGPIDGTFETDGTVTVWELATGKEKATFEEEKTKIGEKDGIPHFVPSFISSVAFSPDGKLLAMSILNKVKVQNLATQKTVLALEEHGAKDGLPAKDSMLAMFTGVVFSPDGKTLATGHNRAGVKLWDAETGKERTTLAKPEGEGWIIGGPLAFSRDGKTLVTLNNRHQIKDGYHVTSGEVNIWDSPSGKLRQRLPAESFVTSIALSRDGKMLAVGYGPNGKVKVEQAPPPPDKAPPKPVGDPKGTMKIWRLKG